MLKAEGAYLGYLEGGVVTTSKGSGVEQMAVVFNVTKAVGPDGDWADIAPSKVTLYMSFSDAAWPYTEAKLVGLGFNGDFDSPDFSEESKTDGVVLNCQHEIWEGKPREKWELGNVGTGPKKADASVIKRVQARWNNAHRSAPAGRPAAPPPARRPGKAAEASHPDPADVPF